MVLKTLSRSGGVSNCKKTKLVLSSDENQTLTETGNTSSFKLSLSYIVVFLFGGWLSGLLSLITASRHGTQRIAGART